MPGHHKYVRFAPMVDVHTMTPPPLTHASWSPASSGGLLTPPSAATGLPGPSPYYVNPYPQKMPHASPSQLSNHYSPSSARVHPLLKGSPSPLLRVDLRDSPSHISSYAHKMSSRSLSEPATEPATSRMTIVCPHLPWTVTVRANKHSYVTVGDVFDELYHSLRKNCSSSEYYSLPSEKDRRRATVAYEERYRRIRSTREYEDEKRRGLRRVDLLMGHVMFKGLHPSSQDRDTWVLTVE